MEVVVVVVVAVTERTKVERRETIKEDPLAIISECCYLDRNANIELSLNEISKMFDVSWWDYVSNFINPSIDK